MKYRIAVIAGDGIGQEVMPEGLRVLEAASRKFGLDLEFTHFDWAHCDYYLKHGQMMPDDWFAQLKGFDAIYFGAVGWPATVPTSRCGARCSSSAAISTSTPTSARCA